jgi:acyl-CoA synthetase (AMP-forming)/AMP-acid ligase II
VAHTTAPPSFNPGGSSIRSPSCVFGISRAATVWCPINQRNEATENQFIIDAFDCSVLLFHSGFAPMVEKLRPARQALRTISYPSRMRPALQVPGD